MYKKIAVFLCTLGSTTTYPSFDFLSELFDQQIQMIEHMQDVLELGHSRTQRASFASATTREDSKKGIVKIIVQGIESESFDATVQEDPHALIIQAGDNQIWAQVTQTNTLLVRVEAKQQWSQSISESAQSLSRPVNLENPIIEYDPDRKELSISLELESKKSGKSIPVTVNRSKIPNPQPLHTKPRIAAYSECDEK